MVKSVFKAIDNLIGYIAGIVVIIGILLALTGHLDVIISQGMRSAGACFVYLK